MPDLDGRPDPLGDAVTSQSPLPAATGALATALLGAGIISQSGVNLVAILLVAGASAVTGLTSYVAARRVAKAARAGVTPNGDPRTDNGEQLVPARDQMLVDVLEQLAAGLANTTAAPARQPPPPPTAPFPAQADLQPAPQGLYGDFHRDDLIAADAAAAALPRGRRAQQPAMSNLPVRERSTGRHSAEQRR